MSSTMVIKVRFFLTSEREKIDENLYLGVFVWRILVFDELGFCFLLWNLPI